MANNLSQTNDNTKRTAKRGLLYHGLSARAARKLGVRPAHVSLVLHGKRISPRVIGAMADEVRRFEAKHGIQSSGS